MPLGRRTDYGDARYAGVEVDVTEDVERDLNAAQAGGFDFLVAPLALPRDTAVPAAQLRPPLPRSDFLLHSTQWSNQVVGRLSAWLAPDSADPQLRNDSEAALRAELSWAAHLSLQAVVLPLPAGPCANYARVTTSVLTSLSHTAVWVRVPLIAPAVSAVEGTPQEEELLLEVDAATRARVHDPWEWWNTFRVLCDGQAALGVVIDIGASLPPDDDWRRWIGEPLRAAVLSTEAFLTNKRGFPVLSKRHQELVCCLLKHNVQIVLRGERRHNPAAGDAAAEQSSAGADDAADGAAAPAEGRSTHELQLYWEYLAYLFGRLEEVSEQERVESGYRDYLQAPLQPLMDNLESQTYETFEKDDTKYNTYEEAVFRALQDMPPPTPAEASGPGGGAVVVMVVGAGRGPLVKASLRAGERAQRPLRVYAVEKNPNAVVHLHALHASQRWGARVTIVSHDMRTWVAPEPANIMVSELLGSFGDNELSPECLDGAQRFLAPNGVSIPQSYTSFLAPITASKLHNDVKGISGQGGNEAKHFETPYVVKLHRVALLADALPVFRFDHPNRDACIDNNRYLAMRFERGPDTPGAMMHGFAGYFDAELYKDVHLSIYPPTHTPNMFSWFPIYFPLRTPVYVPSGAAIEAQMWRCGNHAKVWYEWCTTAPQASLVHNANGRSYFVGL